MIMTSLTEEQMGIGRHIELDTPSLTTYERIIRYIEHYGKISMMDNHEVRATAISQRCNEMRRNPAKYEKYLKGRRIEGREVSRNDVRFTEYCFTSKVRE